MGLFSFFRKNKQESASGQGEFLSRSAGESSAARSSRSGANSHKSGKEDSVDLVLPEKKRARRRLIGAVALVLAVVIVLPMILDSEPRPLADDIAIQIPSKDSKDVSADARPAVAQPQEEFVDPATLAPAAKADVKENKTAEPAEHKDDDKKDVKEVAKPKVADQPDDAARALAILEGKPAMADKKPAAAGGKFVIQVAALARQEKIDELRNKLSGAGIKSFTQKVATQSGERTRIRVGPFASRDEADKMRAKINKLGLNATIVPA